MEGIEFTEPVPEINNAKNRVKAAHIQHEKKIKEEQNQKGVGNSVRLERDKPCLLYTSPSPRDATLSRMPSSA